MTDMNEILNRKTIEDEIRVFLREFNDRQKDIQFKKGIYIYGSPGCGKTRFIMDLLKKMDYDIIQYDAGDVRNKSLIDTITNNHMASHNVLQMMYKRKKPIVIVMDEIEGMNNGDKGGITALIKLIRQKKTKKQKAEDMTMNPIICIGNYYIDKKIKELMKVCNIFELKPPTTEQMKQLISDSFPILVNNTSLISKIHTYINSDLRKFNFIQNIYKNNPSKLTEDILDIFHMKIYNEDSKNITRTLINQPFQLSQHLTYMNDTDRTIVALLWHENIIDAISKYDKSCSIPFYIHILENMCFSDYVDRITFQNQIWQFNEMSSLIKTFYNNKIYHESFPNTHETKTTDEIRFTKVLTKYSTEYNNLLFIYNMCQQLNMDKKDLIAMFLEIRLKHGENCITNMEKMSKIEAMFEPYGVNKLDIRRMYRYLDKNVKKDVIVEEDVLEDDL
jgi:hypothetical protein